MIIMRGGGNGKELLILGLSDMNMQKMKEGRPLHIRREIHGEGIPEGWEIIIMNGRTEKEMADQFRAMGIINQDTEVQMQPKKGD